MATHPRIAIRDALKAALDNAGLVDGLGNSVMVYVNRTYPLAAADCPAALVYMEGESSEVFNEAPRWYQRTAQYLVDIAVTDADPDDSTGPDDTLANIAWQVEQAILVDDTLGGTAAEALFQEMSELGEANAGDGIIMAQTLTFQAVYYTAPDEDPATLDDWTGVYTEWHLEDPASPDSDPDAEDNNTLPQ